MDKTNEREVKRPDVVAFIEFKIGSAMSSSMGKAERVYREMLEVLDHEASQEKQIAELTEIAEQAAEERDGLKISLKDAQKSASYFMQELQSYQQAFDEAGEELPKKIICEHRIQDNNHNELDCKWCMRNIAIDQCTIAFAKLVKERDEAYKKLDRDTVTVLEFQAKIVELVKENEEKDKVIEELKKDKINCIQTHVELKFAEELQGKIDKLQADMASRDKKIAEFKEALSEWYGMA